MTAKLKSVKLKEKQVEDLAEQIAGAKTFMIVSIKNLPSKQFQEIKKSVREHAQVKVSKKNIMDRAIDSVGKESILKLKKNIEADCAFVISDLESYELAGILSKKKTPVFAKAGQIASNDIEVKGGLTDLVPGPAISELGALGLQVAVEEGKISIKKSKVVIKEGQVIDENAASLFQKLHIQPFTVGLNIKVAYDVEKEKIYTNINIDSEGFAEELRIAAGKSLGFAQKIVYYCKETIGYFLAKANAENESLSKLVPEEKVEEKVEEKKVEETDSSERDETSEIRAGESESKPKILEDTKVEKEDTKTEEPTEEKKEVGSAPEDAESHTQLNNPEDKG